LTGHLGSPERVLFGIKIIMGDLEKLNMMKVIPEMCCAIKSDTLVLLHIYHNLMYACFVIIKNITIVSISTVFHKTTIFSVTGFK
jgi:hypothetical protein